MSDATAPYPDCFDSSAQYEGWLAWAIESYGKVSPCDDCTGTHAIRMHEQQRCRRKTVERDFCASGKRTPPGYDRAQMIKHRRDGF